MNGNKTLMVMMIILIFLISACTGGEKEPTIDANAIYTQAAQTVEAQLTEAAALLPTATETQLPTATQLPPTPTKVITALSSPIPLFTMPVGTLPAGTLPATASTATQSVKKMGDHAKWFYTHPSDGTHMSSNEGFTFIVGMGNVGSTTWDTNYRLVHTGGAVISTIFSKGLEWEVKPGETAEFYILAKAPYEKGSHTTYWQIVNPSGIYVQESMYFQFYVD